MTILHAGRKKTLNRKYSKNMAHLKAELLCREMVGRGGVCFPAHRMLPVQIKV